MVSPPRFGLSDTLMLPGALITVMFALADAVESLTEVAVSVTVPGFGAVSGAVYVIAVPDALDVLEMAPQDVPLQPAPDSVHVAPLFCASFLTVAVNVSELLISRVLLFGETLTAIGGPGGAVIVIAAEAETLLLLTDVAVIVTLAGFGAVAGAVYVTAVPDPAEVADSVPQEAPLQPVPDNVQVTPLLCTSF
jgi:hypothetical protein